MTAFERNHAAGSKTAARWILAVARTAARIPRLRALPIPFSRLYYLVDSPVGLPYGKNMCGLVKLDSGGTRAISPINAR